MVRILPAGQLRDVDLVSTRVSEGSCVDQQSVLDRSRKDRLLLVSSSRGLRSLVQVEPAVWFVAARPAELEAEILALTMVKMRGAGVVS